VARDDEIESQLEDLVLRRARVGVRERVAGRGELVEEPPRDGEVKAAQVRGERLDLGALRACRLRCRDECDIMKRRVGTLSFFRKK
jgi:hypothetical protein